MASSVEVAFWLKKMGPWSVSRYTWMISETTSVQGTQEAACCAQHTFESGDKLCHDRGSDSGADAYTVKVHVGKLLVEHADWVLGAEERDCTVSR